MQEIEDHDREYYVNLEIEELQRMEKLQALVDERIRETENWKADSIGKVGISNNQSMFVTNVELKSIVKKSEK